MWILARAFRSWPQFAHQVDPTDSLTLPCTSALSETEHSNMAVLPSKSPDQTEQSKSNTAMLPPEPPDQTEQSPKELPPELSDQTDDLHYYST